MTLAAQTASEVVQLSRHYKANIDQVFAAWSDPEALGQWFGPSSHRCKIEKFDFRTGGEYQIRMIPTGKDSDCGGDTSQDSVCAGQFVEIKAPNKLAMTFTWIENGGDIGNTLLTVELKSRGKGTDVILIHEKLPNEAMRQAHASGWEGSLESLERYLTSTH